MKLPALTSIRAIAAWWVVLFHTKEHLVPFLPGFIGRLIASGYIGVDLFFILSGFVIELNYGPSMERGLSAWIDFLKRRFARIYPLHFVILCGLSVYAMLVYAHSGRLTQNYDFTYLPAHFLLIQAWGIDSALRWNDPSWSISAEMMAYFLFPLIAFGTRPRRWPLAVQLAAVVGLVGVFYLGFRAVGIRDVGQGVMAAGLFRCVIEFAIGVILCAVFVSWRGRIDGRLPLALMAGALFGAIAAVALGISDIIYVPLAFASLVLGLAFADARGRTILDARALVYLGDISYSTYLVHFALLVLVKAFQRPGALIPPIELAAYFAAVALASVLLYRFVELPAQRALLDRMGLGRRRLVEVAAP